MLVLVVGHGGRPATGDPGNGVEEAVDVLAGGVDSGAGPDCAGHPPAVTVKDGGAIVGDLRRRQPQQAQEVGVGAEAAVTYADCVLCAEPGGDESVGDTVDDERGNG